MNSAVKICKKLIPSIISIGILILLILNPKIAKESAKNGLILAGNVIIPTLFPFLVSTLILYKSKFLNIIRFPKKFTFMKDYFIIFLLSNLGGYPIGAKLISEKYSKKEITKKNSELLLLCSINSGPSFCILAVGGGILNSLNLGVILYISQLFSSLLMFSVISKKFSREIIVSNERKLSFSEIFVSSVSDSSFAMLNICGYIVICSTISGVLNNTNINSHLKMFFNFSFEISNAILSTKNVYILSIILSFASFSIIFQILSICKEISPSFKKIIISRIIHSGLSVTLTYLILKISHYEIQTIGNISKKITIGYSSYILTALFLLTLIALVNSLNTKNYCGKISKDIF